MAQFDIYKGTGEGCDFLLNLQDEMLSDLSTRVVAPLATLDSVGSPMRTLNPQISLGGEQYILLTHLMAAIPASSLGRPVGSAALQRNEIIASIDLLFTGI